ncbi:MAG: hypothetical protein P1P67_09455 [Treponema phagedenis]|uniref:hypothetical protein n=1 Tax=Treponema phagedenis TaxID=162 RepID=UPI0031341214
MFNEKTQKHIDKAVKAELKTALAQGAFADLHHAYAILKEEFEEANDMIKIANSAFNMFWNSIKYNETDDSKYFLKEMQRNTNEAIKELCQVLAVIKKTQR